MSALKDSKAAVRDTAAWALGRICKFHHKALNETDSLNVLKAMGEALADKPRVAANAAWTIHNMAFAFRADKHNPLITFFSDVVNALLNVSDRKDGDEHNLRNSAYESLNVVFATAPPNVQPILGQTLEIILGRLEKSFSMGNINRDKLNEVQGYLCGVLQILIHQLESTILPISDKIMYMMIHLLKSQADQAVHEECLLTVAALANATREYFVKYLPDFSPILIASISNWEDYQVCLVGTSLVGDICRAVETKIADYSDLIMQNFCLNLANKDLDKSVKPATLSAIGDIALALVAGPCDLKFSKYLPVVMNVLDQATFTVIDPDIKPDDYELADYVQSLKVGILEAYIGICQSLNDSGEGSLIYSNIKSIVDLLVNIAEDTEVQDETVRLAVGLCGDLITLYEGDIKQIIPQKIFDWVKFLVKKGESEETRETATWTAQSLFQ